MLTGRNSYHKMPYSPLWNFRRFWVGKIFFWKVTSRPNFMRGIRKWQWKILKKFFEGQKIEKNASKLEVISFNPNKIIFRGNFVRGIDCAHRKILKKFFGGQKPPKIILLGLKLTTPNFDAFFQFFDPRKIFSDFFDACNRFLAQNYP